LDVEVIEGKPAQDTTPFVLEKPGRFSIGNSNLVAKRAQGAPIVVCGVLFQHTPDVLMFTDSSGIRKPSDLVGRTVMATGQSRIQFKSLLVSEGIAPETVRWIEHTLKLDDLTNRKVDAIGGYLTNELYRFRNRGVQVRTLRPIDYGVDFYGDLLYTS